MSTSIRRVKRIDRVKRASIAALLVAMMALPVSPHQAQVIGARVSRACGWRQPLISCRSLKKSPKRIDTLVRPQLAESAGRREARVARISLCPRRVLMYVGEQHSLSPLPLDTTGAAVHGVVFSFESSAAQIADVATDGSVTALKPGDCFVAALVGQRSARVKVEVRDGLRPRLTNAAIQRAMARSMTCRIISTTQRAGWRKYRMSTRV